MCDLEPGDRRRSPLGIGLVIDNATGRLNIEVEAIKIESTDDLLEGRLQLDHIRTVGT